jgi:hypothetical protein
MTMSARTASTTAIRPNGVSSLVISLYPGNAPTDDSGETGFEHTSDNQIDAAVDLTIDFGFQTPVGVGNLVYIDSNENGFADVGEGVDGVTVELYRADQTPGFGLPIFSRITSNGGRYFFDSLPAGDYIACTSRPRSLSRAVRSSASNPPLVPATSPLWSMMTRPTMKTASTTPRRSSTASAAPSSVWRRCAAHGCGQW